MKLFLYEYVTGGGLLQPTGAQPIPPSLLREGRAMVEALAADFAAIGGVEPVLLRDSRVPLHLPGCRVLTVDTFEAAGDAFHQLAATSDQTLLIAPEIGGALMDCCRRVIQCRGRLLGPNAGVIAIASDKHATACHLAAAGLPVPEGIALDQGQPLPLDFAYPAVLKPRNGAGSQGVQRVETAEAAAALGPVAFAARLERFCAGTAASVAVLCGPREVRPLVPCRQVLSDDGRFTYLGGALPLEPAQAARASRLAEAAARALTSPCGYLGFDLVLGETDEMDKIIEINPRLTTSYVGLRAALRGNLAEAMLRIARGEPAELSFRGEPLQFDASGNIRRLQGTLS